MASRSRRRGERVREWGRAGGARGSGSGSERSEGERSPGPAGGGGRPLLRSAAVQPGDHLVDRRNGSPGGGNHDSRRNLSATLYSRWRRQSSSGAGGRKRSLMSVPVSQMFTVASYVITQKLRGRKRYPLVLMLELL